ncbi:MAG: DUF2806 domain-containing protein [Aeromonas sp.]
MQFPCENLIIRLWESVERLSLGALHPYQMKRLQHARHKAEVEEILHQSKIEKIKGDLDLIRGVESAPESQRNTMSAIINQRNREEKNAIASIQHAYQQLVDDSSVDDSSENNVDSDWLHRWYGYASKVSNEELQQLWGKLLAGEVKRCNSISYRLMDFIDKLTSKEIDEITMLLSIVEKNNEIIFRGFGEAIPFFEKNGIVLDFIQKYTDLGVLSSYTTGAVNVITDLDFEKFYSFDFVYGDKTIVVKLNSDKKEKKKIMYYSLGANGLSLYRLSEYASNKNYLDDFSSNLTKNNMTFEFVGP